MQRSSGGRLEAELCLISLCSPQVSAGDTAALAGRLAALETKLASGVFSSATPPAASGQPEADSASPRKDIPSADDDCPFPLEDEAPPPPGDGDAPPEPADSMAPPKRPARPAPKPGGNDTRREIPSESKVAILKALSGVLSRSAYTHLTLSKMYYEDHVLTLAVEGEISMMLLDKAEIRATISGAASRILGGNCMVRVSSANREQKEASLFDGFDAIMNDGRAAGVKIETKS